MSIRHFESAPETIEIAGKRRATLRDLGTSLHPPLAEITPRGLTWKVVQRLGASQPLERVEIKMYLGLDLGTSGTKVVLCDDEQSIVAQAEMPLTSSRPAPLWSEQNPADWWHSVLSAFDQLHKTHSKHFPLIKAIGLAGQMHGAVLLDAEGEILRPAILWNDGRSAAECEELKHIEPKFTAISGNLLMPGFTAPKLLWVAKNEPNLFQRVAKVLLPKDYIRFCLTGEYISDMSDAAGTLWLDVAARDWSDSLLAATGLKKDQMPRLVEGTEVAGYVKAEICQKYGFSENIFVAGGAGDNAAGAVGIGIVEPGQAFLSLGTSGVLFVSNDRFSPHPKGAVHTFCHCFSNRWHQMSVILSAASCLTWVTGLTGAKDETALLAEVADAGRMEDKLLFLPYLSGERTPHNDPNAMGVFFGLTHATNRAALARAVLEGVAFAFADGMDALLSAEATMNHISVIGGGAKSDLWGRILSDTLGRELTYHVDGELGPAYGAARLARVAATNEKVIDVCTAPEIKYQIKPDRAKSPYYQSKLQRYRRLYKVIKQEFVA